MSSRRVRKLARILRTGDYRRALVRGVAATAEYEDVPFAHEFHSVIDVGAHFGQFAVFAAHRFPGAALVCVEPLTEAHARLRKVVPDAHVIPYAAYAERGRRPYHVSSKSVASSLLPGTRILAGTFRGVREAEVREVECRPLDDLVAEERLPPPRLLKIDVQGTELQVLRGAERLLRSVDEVFVECSFVELYRGQALAQEVIEFVHERSFRHTGTYAMIRDSERRPLQADLLFRRSS